MQHESTNAIKETERCQAGFSFQAVLPTRELRDVTSTRQHLHALPHHSFLEQHDRLESIPVNRYKSRTVLDYTHAERQEARGVSLQERVDGRRTAVRLRDRGRARAYPVFGGAMIRRLPMMTTSRPENFFSNSRTSRCCTL
jgi:hypothetical protein